MDIVDYLQVEKLYKLTGDKKVFKEFTENNLRGLLFNTPALFLLLSEEELYKEYMDEILKGLSSFEGNDNYHLERSDSANRFAKAFSFILEKEYDYIKDTIEEPINYRGNIYYLLELILEVDDLDKLLSILDINEESILYALSYYYTIQVNILMTSHVVPSDMSYKIFDPHGPHHLLSGRLDDDSSVGINRRKLIPVIDEMSFNYIKDNDLIETELNEKVINLILDNKEQFMSLLNEFLYTEFVYEGDDKSSLFDNEMITDYIIKKLEKLGGN